MSTIDISHHKLKILSLEDSVNDFEIIRELLKRAGFVFEIDRTENRVEFEKALSEHDYDIILSDFNLPGYDAFEALAKSIKICPDIPFIVVSGSIGEETAIELIKHGAVDYILKDKPDKLPYSINRALQEAEEKKERKKAEIELIKAKEKAEESDRLKSAFLANMSHEIRTPMNGILGFAELLKAPNLSGEKQQKYIRIIEKSGQRMLNIINDIINISKIESGTMEISLQDSNINMQMEDVYSFFKPEISQKGMAFSLKDSLPINEVITKTDKEKIYSILTNLIKNAIKFSEKGSIEFGCTKSDNYLKFYVKDTGIGVAKNRQEAIFERFIQADIADKMARQGAGLGLSISKAYVEMLGGKIWMESNTIRTKDGSVQETQGSTFYFTIPYHGEDKKKIHVIDEVTPHADNSLSKKLKILIAEDDETSIELMSIVLHRYGREIIFVKSGNDAVEACLNDPGIDLIIMDIRMPEMDGYEATRQIRKFNKQVKIIAQTAYALQGDKEKAMAAGCNDYISKPIDTDQLEQKIVDQLKGNPGQL